MATRRVHVTMTPVVRRGRITPWYVGENRGYNPGHRTITMSMDLPVRGMNGQRMSKRLLLELANDPSRNNELFDEIDEHFEGEYGLDPEEYGVDYERNVTGGIFDLDIETDDELDASSSEEDIEIVLNEDDVEGLAVELIELVREASPDGFYDSYLMQEVRGDETRRRQNNALHLLGYINNGEHDFDDDTHGSIVALNRDVGTGVEGETRPLTWGSVATRDRARVIRAVRAHLQEESTYWTHTDQGHVSRDYARPGDTTEDYVERQIDLWKGGDNHDNYRDMMYNAEHHDEVEQKLRDHLTWRYNEKNDRLLNDPSVWFNSWRYEIADMLHDQANPVIDPDYRPFVVDGAIDTHRVMQEATDITDRVIEEDVLFYRFDLPANILNDPARMGVLRTELRELVQGEITRNIPDVLTPPGSPPDSPVMRTPPGSPPLGYEARTPPGSPSDGGGGDEGWASAQSWARQRRARMQQAVSSLAGQRVTDGKIESQALDLARREWGTSARRTNAARSQFNRLVESNAQQIRRLLPQQASSSSSAGPAMRRSLELQWSPGDTRIVQAAFGVTYTSAAAYEGHVGSIRARSAGCAYEAIEKSSMCAQGKQAVSVKNIGSILRRCGYSNFVDGMSLTPQMIMELYQYNTKRIVGSDMPYPINQSCYILDITGGTIAKARYCEMHPEDPAGYNRNLKPGIFVVFPAETTGAWHIEAVIDESTKAYIQYNTGEAKVGSRVAEGSVSAADRMIESVTKVRNHAKYAKKSATKRKVDDDASGAVVTNDTAQLCGEDHYDEPAKEGGLQAERNERYVYPPATEDSITHGRIVEVDGNDLTQFAEGGWWWEHMRDPAALTTEMVHPKSKGVKKVDLVIVCVTGVDHLNLLDKWFRIERKWENGLFDVQKQAKSGLVTKSVINIGKYNIRPVGNVSVRDILFVHRSKFPNHPFRGDGLAVYADAILRLGVDSGYSVDWASVYSEDFKACMTDQQRGVGMNPPRGCVDVYRDPNGHVTLQDGDTDLRATRIDAVRMYTSCLRWLFEDPQRVPAIYGATDCLVEYDEVTHGHIPCGHYIVELSSDSRMRHTMTHYTMNDRGVVLDHNTVRHWLREGFLTKPYIKMVILPLHSRQQLWGPRLALAINKLLAYTEQIERSGDVGKSLAKKLINHLVGTWAKITHCSKTVKSVAATDPSYLNALLFTSGLLKCGKARIARHQGTDFTFNANGTDFDYYEVRTSFSTPKSFTHHTLYLSVTLRNEVEMVTMLGRLPGPKCELSGLSQWLIAAHVDCVEYYRPLNDMDYAYTGAHMATQAKGVGKGPVEYGKWAHEADGLRVDKVNGEYNAAYYQQLSARRHHVRKAVRPDGGPPPPSARPQQLNQLEVPFIVGDMYTTKAMRMELFKAKANDIVYKHYRLFKRSEVTPMPGILMSGPPGVGKTYGLNKMHETAVEAELDVTVLAPTGAAAEALNHASNGAMDPETMHSFLGIQIWKERGKIMRCIRKRMDDRHLKTKWPKKDVIIIDECSMIHDSVWEVFMLYKRTYPDCVFIISGDFNQLPPVYAGSPVGIEFGEEGFDAPNVYTHSDVIHDLLKCPRTHTQGTEWIFRHSMRSALCPVLRTVALNPRSIEKINPADWAADRGGIDRAKMTWFNICYTNPMRDRLSARTASKWVSEHPDAQVYDMRYNRPDTAASNRPPEQAIWAVGMPLVCLHNGYSSDTNGLKNNRFGTLVDIKLEGGYADVIAGDESGIRVMVQGQTKRLATPDICMAHIKWNDTKDNAELEMVPLSNFPAWFIRGFAITAHSSQGLNLGADRYVGIHEFHKLLARCPRGLYVALTRVVSSNQLWCQTQASERYIKSAYSVRGAVIRNIQTDKEKNWPLAGLKSSDSKNWPLDRWIDVNWFESEWITSGQTCFRCECAMHRDPTPDGMDRRVTIDRQDNDMPHFKENCKLVCWVCNSHNLAKKGTVGPPKRRELHTATPVHHDVPDDLLKQKCRLAELTLENTILAIKRDLSKQVNRVRGLYHAHKLTPLECATLLRRPAFQEEVTESERTVLDRSRLCVKPVDIVQQKTAKEIMIESLRACNDDDEDMDDMMGSPPPLVMPPPPVKVESPYVMTPAALKYHEMNARKPKISVIRPKKTQDSVMKFM